MYEVYIYYGVYTSSEFGGPHLNLYLHASTLKMRALLAKKTSGEVGSRPSQPAGFPLFLCLFLLFFFCSAGLRE